MSFSSPDAAEFLERLPQRWARSLLWAFVAMLVALSGWAAWCRIDVSVSGRGVLEPAAGPTWVQAPGHGLVQDVWVQPGDSVAAGGRLLALSGQVLTAPAAGLVTAVRVVPGASVEAGEVLVGLVTSDTPFQFEALIPNRDIGHVQVGQAAFVHLDAYPLERFGSLPATVDHIEPVLEPGEHPFRIVLRLGRQTVVGGSQDVHPLTAALTGDVQLVVGQQSLLQLILHPAL